MIILINLFLSFVGMYKSDIELWVWYNS